MKMIKSVSIVQGVGVVRFYTRVNADSIPSIDRTMKPAVFIYYGTDHMRKLFFTDGFRNHTFKSLMESGRYSEADIAELRLFYEFPRSLIK